MTLSFGIVPKAGTASLAAGQEPAARHDSPAMAKPLRFGKVVKVAYALVLAASLAAALDKILAAVGSSPSRPDISDFNVFMLAGRLALTGHLADAYRLGTMLSMEQALGGGRLVMMPWSYPPLFGLVLAPLALFPLSLAFLGFVTATLGLFLSGLRRLAGADDLWAILLCSAPVVLINIRTGQNGLLTGALLAIAAQRLLTDRPLGAGAAIGCLAIKPHLALMLPLLLSLRRRWVAFGVAAAGALGLTGISILVFGLPTFKACLASFAMVEHIMALGAYPMHRMTSLYACLITLGVPSGAAILLHGAAALAIVGATIPVLRSATDPRVAIGLALLGSVFLSPYFYDYDQTVFAVGLSLVASRLRARLTPRRFGLLLGAIAFAEAVGAACDSAGIELSLGGPVLLAVYGLMLCVLTAPRRRPADGAGQLRRGGVALDQAFKT